MLPRLSDPALHKVSYNILPGVAVLTPSSAESTSLEDVTEAGKGT